MGALKPHFTVFFILILCALSFSLVEWSTSASEGINGKIVVSSNRAVFTSLDGNVYAVDADSGTTAWVYSTGETISLEPSLADSETVAIGTDSGRIILFDVLQGKLKAEMDLFSPIVSIAAGDGRVFASANKTIYAFSSAGSGIWNKTLAAQSGQLGYSNGVLYFTSSKKLYALSAQSGGERFVSPAEDSFLSRPAEYQGAVYVGCVDGRLYAFDVNSGRLKWKFKTGGWVMSTPTASTTAVYVGSADGKLYSLTFSGSKNWEFDTGDGIWTQPEIYKSRSSTLVVIGSQNGKLYGVDTSSGEEAWSFSAYGKPVSPTLFESSFIFGTSKGRVYALSPSPICSFTWPKNGDVFGSWPVELEGRASADNGISSVEVRVANGPWVRASGKEDWLATFDFTVVETGAVNVECRSTENGGRTESGEYSFTTLIKTESAPLQKMYLDAPYDVAPNETFTVSALDSRGRNLRKVVMSLGEENTTGDSPFSVVLGKSGFVDIEVSKPGYETGTISVKGRDPGGIWVFIIIGLVVIAAVAIYFLYGKKLISGIAKK